MQQEQSGPDALADAMPGQRESTCGRNPSKPPLKWQRVLTAFLEGRSLNRFEAERLSDHCLHSTVSTLERKGVRIARRTERVPGFMAIPTEVCRYWLEPEARQRARELLGLEPQSNRANAPSGRCGAS